MRLGSAGRRWRFPATVSALGSAKDLLTFTPAAHVSVIVFFYELLNISNATSCPVHTAISKATGGSASGGSEVTAIALDGESGTPQLVVKTGVTGLTYSGSTDEDEAGWPSGIGYRFPMIGGEAEPRDWIWLPAGAANLFALRTLEAPASAFDCRIVFDVIEVVG